MKINLIVYVITFLIRNPLFFGCDAVAKEGLYSNSISTKSEVDEVLKINIQVSLKTIEISFNKKRV